MKHLCIVLISMVAALLLPTAETWSRCGVQKGYCHD